MDQRRRRSPRIGSVVDPHDLRAVIGMRDGRLRTAVCAAVSRAGFLVSDRVTTARGLLAAVGTVQPRLVVACLDVLGAHPADTVRCVVDERPGTAVIVLSPLDTVPVWLLEAGAHEVVAETDIRRLRRVVEAVIAPHRG